VVAGFVVVLAMMVVWAMVMNMPITVAVRVAMRVPMVAVLMPVVPQLGFVEQKEKHHAHQQGGKQVVRARLAFKGLGQQVHKSRGQQCARRQAQKVLGADAIMAPTQAHAHQKGCSPHTANPRSQGGDQDCYQSHSY
jgi:hypothetical protein